MNGYQLIFLAIAMAILNAIAWHIRRDADDDLFCGFFVVIVILVDAVLFIYGAIDIFNLLGNV